MAEPSKPLPTIRFPKVTWGIFGQRSNRFAATVIQPGSEKELVVHVPSSGRMGELLFPGARVAWIPIAFGNNRKTGGKLLLVETDAALVCIDSVMPNRLLWALHQQRNFPPWQSRSSLQPEFGFGRSRFDFAEPGQKYLAEVKSVTLVENERGLFPDSPTTRGTKHVLELTAAAAAGWTADVFFIVQRNDASRFAPNGKKDPDFTQALRTAAAAGVRLQAFKYALDETGIWSLSPLPVFL